MYIQKHTCAYMKGKVGGGGGGRGGERGENIRIRKEVSKTAPQVE